MKKWILPILMAGFLLTGCSSPAATSSALPSSTEKITETQMTEEPGTLEETETGTATETQQEPVIQTVKITATGDCTLGATQTHGYAVNTMINTGRIIFLKMSEVFLSRMILHCSIWNVCCQMRPSVWKKRGT